jgi:hypothetical protein
MEHCAPPNDSLQAGLRLGQPEVNRARLATERRYSGRDETHRAVRGDHNRGCYFDEFSLLASNASLALEKLQARPLRRRWRLVQLIEAKKRVRENGGWAQLPSAPTDLVTPAPEGALSLCGNRKNGSRRVETEHVASTESEQALARSGLPHSEETQPGRRLLVVQVVTSDDAIGQESKEGAVGR